MGIEFYNSWFLRLEILKNDIELIGITTICCGDFEKKYSFFNSIENNEDINRLIKIINNILENYGKINDLNTFKISIKTLLKNFLNEEKINYYSNIIEESKNNYNFDNIKELISLFKLIYSNKNKINYEQIKFFCDTISEILKSEKILNLTNNDINFLIQKMEEILSPNYINANNNNIINLNISEEKETNIQKEDLDISNIKVFSTYSQNSQNQIKKMNNKIRELEAKINESKDKKLFKFIFIDKNNNNYKVNIKLGEYDKFSSVKDKLYENYPELEEIGIKKFIYKEKNIKGKHLIKDLDLDDL